MRGVEPMVANDIPRNVAYDRGCPVCAGHGRIWVNETRYICPRCDGDGIRKLFDIWWRADE